MASSSTAQPQELVSAMLELSSDDEDASAAPAPPHQARPSLALTHLEQPHTLDTHHRNIFLTLLPLSHAQYFEACRSLLPTSTRRDALRAWDSTSGVGAGTQTDKGWDMNGARVQAALGALVDHASTGNSISLDSSPASSLGKHPRSRSASPVRPPPPIIRRSSSPPLEVFASPPPIKRARALDGTTSEEHKGKNKDRTEEIVLGDSDGEADDPFRESSIEVIRSPVKPRPYKGKEKEVLLSPRPRRFASSAQQGSSKDVLDLAADSSDDDQLSSFRLPLTPSQRKRNKSRSPSLEFALPALPTPPPSPLAQILAIVPDVLPAHATALLESPECAGDVEKVLEALFSAKEYPKVDDGEKEEEKEPEKDWMDLEKRKREENPTVLDKRIALDYLYASFPRLSTATIKPVFAAHSRFLAPAYFALHAAVEAGTYAGKELKKPRKAPKPVTRVVAKTRVLENGDVEDYDAEEVEQPPEELKKEMEWIKAKLHRDRLAARAAAAEAAAAKAEEDRIEALNEKARQRGEAVECQCCFDEVAAVNTASCHSGHLFCKSCCANNASDKLGKRQATLPCMAPDCTALFVPSTWPDFLAQKTIDGLERIRQDEEVGKAFEGVEGVETCPFCPYACYIENPNERLFRCERADCRKISCRKCRKEGHVPLTCEEADVESRRGDLHAVAESMTAAFIRHCPKCKVPTAKIDGCNHMICSQCQTHFCYVCKKQINGYSHFSDRGGAANGCPTFDDSSMRNFNEVEEARRAAEAELGKDANPLLRQELDKLAAKQPNRGAARAPVLPVAHQPVAGPAGGGGAPGALPAPVVPVPGAHGGWQFGFNAGGAHHLVHVAGGEPGWAAQQVIAQVRAIQERWFGR
ncbi:hypothetical protein JCM8097_007726 [Rhodosporidiobolus ruineniae]